MVRVRRRVDLLEVGLHSRQLGSPSTSMQAASIVSPLLSKSMRATSSVRLSGLTIDERCIDGADTASTIDAALIDRDRQRLSVDAGCIDGETVRSPGVNIRSSIDAGGIDRESAAGEIDVGCIDGADAASTLDAALIDRDGQRLSVDAGCIDGETTRRPRESIRHWHRRGRHRFRVLSRLREVRPQ